MTQTPPQSVVERVRVLRSRAKLSMEKLARLMGYEAASSIQRYEDATLFKKPTLPLDIALKYAEALAGKGEPPITRAEVLALAVETPAQLEELAHSAMGLRYTKESDLRPLRSSDNVRLPDYSSPVDLPVLGTAQGGNGDADFTMNGETVDFRPRPAALLHARRAFALYVRGTSMTPWKEPGDVVVLNPDRPPGIGDYVVVELFPKEDGGEIPALLKRLVAMTPSQLVLEQFNPTEQIKIARSKVKAVYRVLSTNDLLGI